MCPRSIALRLAALGQRHQLLRVSLGALQFQQRQQTVTPQFQQAQPLRLAADVGRQCGGGRVHRLAVLPGMGQGSDGGNRVYRSGHCVDLGQRFGLLLCARHPG